MTEVCEEVQSGSVYTLAEFQKRTGLKRDALRTARRHGLKVTYKHNRAFVLGKHWLEYLSTSSQ